MAKAYYDRSDEYRLKSSFKDAFQLDVRDMPQFKIEGAMMISKINQMLADNPQLPHTDANDILSFTEKETLKKEMTKGIIAAAQEVQKTAKFYYIEEGKYYTCHTKDGQKYDMHLGDNYACPCPGEKFCQHILAARMKWGLADKWEVPPTANIQKRMPAPKHPFNKRKIRPSSKKPKATDDYDPAVHTSTKPRGRSQRQKDSKDIPDYIGARLNDTIPSAVTSLQSQASSSLDEFIPISKLTKSKFQDLTRNSVRDMTGYSNSEIREIYREERERIKELRKKKEEHKAMVVDNTPNQHQFSAASKTWDEKYRSRHLETNGFLHNHTLLNQGESMVVNLPEDE